MVKTCQKHAEQLFLHLCDLLLFLQSQIRSSCQVSFEHSFDFVNLSSCNLFTLVIFYSEIVESPFSLRNSR